MFVCFCNFYIFGSSDECSAVFFALPGSSFERAIFADDSAKNIESAKLVCRVYPVQRPCLQTADMQKIFRFAQGK